MTSKDRKRRQRLLEIARCHTPLRGVGVDIDNVLYKLEKLRSLSSWSQSLKIALEARWNSLSFEALHARNNREKASAKPANLSVQKLSERSKKRPKEASIQIKAKIL